MVMSEKIWVRKLKSFAESQEFDDFYYLSVSEKERLETVQFLREEYWKLNKEQNRESRKGLRRVLKLIPQPSSQILHNWRLCCRVLC